jgi:hypothetical protein
VVRDDDRHIKVDGEFAQSGDGLVIMVIRGFSAALAKRSNPFQDIDGDKRDLAPGCSGAFNPFANVVEAALVGASPLGRESEVLRPFRKECQ